MLRRRRTVPENIRITKVGLWYVLLTVLVAIAATNTGNNALYMVVSLMLALLVVSGVASRQNVRGMDIEVEPPREVFANRPAALRVTVANRGRLLPRWFLVVDLDRRGPPLLVPYLPRRDSIRGELEVILPRRGPHALRHAHVSSLFPFGLFRKGVRHRLDLEVLVFPEIYPASSVAIESAGDIGDGAPRRAVWGHELHGLRGFRQGDDPRGIHWKQTARTGELIYVERQAESGRRLSIVLDNGIGRTPQPPDAERFEGLVSEAATAAVDHLGRGFEVELVSRDGRLPFAAGPRQRRAVLEALARIEPVTAGGGALLPGDRGSALLRLRLEGEAAA
jgi:uncharacterized protein (DUF58 family)